MVDEWGETKRPFRCHSMRKSILSALYGPHILAGKIKTSSTLAELGIDDNEPSLTETEKNATVRNLLKARSGIYHPTLYETKSMAAKRPVRGSHLPDAFWYYNNWDFNTLCSIFENESGRGIFEEFEDILAGPLGMQDFIRAQHTQYVTGKESVHPAYPFILSARDLARFGLRRVDVTHRDRSPQTGCKPPTRDRADGGPRIVTNNRTFAHGYPALGQQAHAFAGHTFGELSNNLGRSREISGRTPAFAHRPGQASLHGCRRRVDIVSIKAETCLKPE